MNGYAHRREGCIAGAMERTDYLDRLTAAGFVDASIEPTRFYAADEVGEPALVEWLQTQPGDERARLNRAFQSAFVRARKPGL